MPSFNHTRADGPYDPCPECLLEMTHAQLVSLAKSLRAQLDTIRSEVKSTSKCCRPTYGRCRNDCNYKF